MRFRSIWQRRAFLELAALVFLAILLGGSNWHAPFLVAVLESVALFVLADAILFSDHRAIGRGGVAVLCLVALLLVVGAAQLVPLPHAVWERLPGRPLLAGVLQALGRPGETWPLSMAPVYTRSALLSFLPPVAVLVGTLHLSSADRLRLIYLVVALGVVSALLGFLQIGTGGGEFTLYGLPPFDVSVGLFANRDHHGLFLAACFILTVAAWLESAGRGVRISGMWLAVVLLLLALAEVGTSSRSGLALMALAAFGGGLLLLQRQALRARQRGAGRPALPRRTLLVGAAVVVVLLLGLRLGMDSYRFGLMSDRFQRVSEDLRFEFWTNSLYVLKLYFPAGAGFGTFDIVYESAEPLTSVIEVRANHAHNDYLELLIEAGAAGAALLALFAGWLVWRLAALRGWAAERPGGALARAAGLVVIFVLLHSLVDYPIRTESIACLFALCCGLLVPPAATERSASRRVRLDAAADHAR